MIKITDEISLREFEAWSGAEDTKDKILEAGKAEEFESYIADCFPDGLSSCELNDILRFDSQKVLEDLDIEEIDTSEIIDILKNDNLEELKEAFKNDDTIDYELSNIIDSNYKLSGQVRESQYNDIVEELDEYLQEITEKEEETEEE